MDDENGDVTALLRAVRDGLPGAGDRLMALVYSQLKQIARNRAGSATYASMDPTTLAHEAYLRLFGKNDASWENRHHFFWAAARAMRDILVEKARHDVAEKRGGGRRPVPLSDDLALTSDAHDLLMISEAVGRLEAAHPDTARLVMLRFFAGLTREQVSEVTGLSPSAIWREWNFAKAWLLAEMEGMETDKPSSPSGY